MTLIIEHIISHAKHYFWGVLIVMALLLTLVKNPGFDGSFESLGIRKNHYISDMNTIDSIFHEDKKVFIEVIPEETNLETIVADMDSFNKHLKQEFDTISFRSVIKLANVFYSNQEKKKTPVKKALEKFSTIKIFQDLVSKDKNSYLLVLGLKRGDPKLIVDKIEQAKNTTQFHGIKKLNITSEFHIENSINQVLMTDIGRIVLSIFIAFILIMILAYRNYFTIFYMMAIVVLTLVATWVVFLQFGVPFNLITLMVLPVVIVLAVADGIHLLTGLSKESTEIPLSQRLKEVYQKYLIPSFLTSLTTSVAFLTLSFNHTKSVVHLGQITGISIMISFIICYLVSPFIIIKWYRSSRTNNRFFVISSFFQQHKSLFTYSLLPLVVIALVLLPQLKFKNDFEIFLPIGSPAKIQHDEIRDHYYSQAALELTFRLKDTLNKATGMKKIAQEIEKVNKVTVVRSAATSAYVKGKFFMPIDLSKMSGYKRRFEADDGWTQRMQVRVSDPNDIPVIEEDIRAILKRFGMSEIRLTSPALIFSFVNKEVAKSLIRSLLISTIFLIFVFYFLTGSMVRAFIGMFANIVPLSVIVIIFVGFHLNINIVTAVTAVVCLGLIVDDTIHAFYRKEVMGQSLDELGFGMLTTTIILVVGFGLFAISSILPIVIFGLVSSFVFVITLISDYTLLFYLLEGYDSYLAKKKNK